MILISASKAHETPLWEFFRFLISSIAWALQNFPLPFSAKNEELCEQSTRTAEPCGMRWVVASVSGTLLFWAAWVDAPSSAKGFQLLQPASQLCQGPGSGASTQTRAAWGTNRRNWRRAHARWHHTGVVGWLLWLEYWKGRL